MNNTSSVAANLSSPAANSTANNTGRTFYVAPDGRDDNTGTIDSPFATLEQADAVVQAGDTIYMRGGTYKPAIDKITYLKANGTAEAPIRLLAYENERPIIDGSDWTRRSNNPGENGKPLIWQEGDYWHVKGIELTGSSRQGYVAESVKGSTYEDIKAYDNDNTGLVLTGEGTENNLILGGDFYRNYDPFKKGQDADGIAIKAGSGKGNVIRGARTYHNSDDGIDLYEFTDNITIEDTWSYGNGVDRWNVGASFDGDGAGFRLATDVPPFSIQKDLSHLIQNNLAWDNAARGFNYNNSQGQLRIYNNTSYNNGVSYAFNRGNHILRNNIAVGGDLQIEPQEGVDDASNSWTLDTTANAEDFVSVDSTRAEGARGADGSLPQTDFLKLKAGSDLIDVGTDVGIDFAGSAPDLGAFEFGSPTEPPTEPPTTGDPANLVLSYSFDSLVDNIARDTSADLDENSGGDNSGRLFGVERAEDERGSYGVFDGDDVIQVDNTRDINLGIQKQRTISLRFKVDDETIDSRKQVIYEEGANVRGLNAYVYDDQLFVGGWNRPAQESGWQGTWLSTSDIEADTWHRLTLVLDGDTARSPDAITAYLDGESFGSGEGSQLWSHSGGIGLGSVNKGTRYHDATFGNKTDGLAGAIDEVRIFNSALSANQVQALTA